MDNEFIVIPKFSKYEINRKGELRNIKTKRFIKYSLNHKDGYCKVTLYQNWKKRYNKYIHRLVSEIFIPNPTNLPYVNHKDGNKLNNHIDNLEWCSPSFNRLHAQIMGLNDLRGEKHPTSKLTALQVLEIRKLVEKGLSQSVIAQQFNIARATVGDIHRREKWKHI